MDPLTLVTTALTLATPFILKTGEKIAENIGEDIWKLIKKPFSSKEEIILSADIQENEMKALLTPALLEKINSDNNYKQELEYAVNKANKELNAFYQQNISNNGQIEKQINIQDNSGNIQM